MGLIKMIFAIVDFTGDFQMREILSTNTKKGKTTNNFPSEKRTIFNLFLCLFFPRPPFSSIFRLRLCVPQWRVLSAKVDCDLCYALINHHSDFAFCFAAHDAINYEENLCCFLSEGDVESDFNWFASVALFRSSSSSCCYLSHYFRSKAHESGH